MRTVKARTRYVHVLAGILRQMVGQRVSRSTGARRIGRRRGRLRIGLYLNAVRSLCALVVVHRQHMQFARDRIHRLVRAVRQRIECRQLPVELQRFPVRLMGGQDILHGFDAVGVGRLFGRVQHRQRIAEQRFRAHGHRVRYGVDVVAAFQAQNHPAIGQRGQPVREVAVHLGR